MKHFLALYKPYMNRPMLYQVLTRFAIGMVCILLWMRFVNQNDSFHMMRDGAIIPALFYLLCAWIAYLKMDGMRLDLALEKRRSRSKSSRFNKGMMDFVETDVVSFSELTEEEQTAVRFGANLLVAALFFAASLVAILFT